MKKYMIIGAGRSGISLCKYLNKKDINCYLCDTNDKEKLLSQPYGLGDILDYKNVEFIFSRQPLEKEILECSLVIISPSVPLKAYPVKVAMENNIEVISEFEFANRNCIGSKIGITGTNGKTTTTTLVGKIFENSGVDTYIGGNIGDAFINYADSGDENSVYALEISSYQLEMLKDFKPDISIITNITPDHLDRHLTMENYISAKGKIFENQDSRDYLIINKDDKTVYELSKKAKCNVLYFTLKEDTLANAYLKGSDIMINYEGEVYKLVSSEEIKLYGLHNVANIMAASLSGIIKGCDIEKIRQTLRRFTSVEHRIEFVRDVEGVEYINDSKGTNCDATIIAIKAMKKPIVLILGGYDKEVEFDELFENFDDKVKGIIIFGQTRQKIMNCAIKHKYNNYFIEEDLASCVKKAKEISKEGDSVLLSPACASFGMYEDFEKRGKHFKDIVNKL